MLNIPYLVPAAASGIWFMASGLYERKGSSCRDKAGAAWLRPPLGEGIILLPTACPCWDLLLPPWEREAAMGHSEGMVTTSMVQVKPFAPPNVVTETLFKQTNSVLNVYQDKCKLGNALEGLSGILFQSSLCNSAGSDAVSPCDYTLPGSREVFLPRTKLPGSLKENTLPNGAGFCY